MTDDLDRSDELLQLIADDARRDQAVRNGHHPDDHGPDEPPPDDGDHYRGDDDRSSSRPEDDLPEPTTWEPLDLGPHLLGEITQPQPSIGAVRSDGLRMIYPGREHAILGETESGKTWFALACVAAELAAGNTVVYIHFEESDPGSTIERLRLLGVDTALIASRLLFVAPGRPARAEWIRPLIESRPTLVVLDGVNEAMSLIGADIMAADGAANFRRLLVTPFLKNRACTLACDHLPKNVEGRGRDAYGSVHKGNAIDGARFVMENVAPFGRRMRGRSNVFVTKDRPGQLRAHGKPTKLPGKTFVGTFVVDDSETVGPDFTVRFFAPKDDQDDDSSSGDAATTPLMEALWTSVFNRGSVSSRSQIIAAAQNDRHKFRRADAFDAINRLFDLERLRDVRDGTKKAIEAVENGSQKSGSKPVPENGSGSGSPKGGNREPIPVPGSRNRWEPMGTDEEAEDEQ
ncbi:hypothetical protein JDV09_15350 [Mycobacterium sp. Y57]|uniref:hypothetical protein n=1 Tax=Mycolicibacterium xanthum TaxID=2796469 RepID=UPI001C84FEBD|nr:hypothetical protein [Mycolicibacterium xanthum]MBX7433476.1 hypothetical protein [Mycolicibacterium xanthum]